MTPLDHVGAMKNNRRVVGVAGKMFLLDGLKAWLESGNVRLLFDEYPGQCEVSLIRAIELPVRVITGFVDVNAIEFLVHACLFLPLATLLACATPLCAI